MVSTELIRSAIKSLLANKGRSLLTILGVVIGVFSVVMMISLGEGVQNYIKDEFDALGSNLIFVIPGQANFTGDPAESFSKNKLDEKHVRLIETYASEHVLDVSPYYVVGDTVSFKTKSYYAEVIGVSHNAVRMFNYPLKIGSNFSKNEQNARSKVAIIGPLIQKELFSTVNPVGQSIRIGDDPYKVIGVFAEKGTNYDDQIIIPFTAAKVTFGLDKFSSIGVKADSSENIDIAVRQVELSLLRDLKEDDFSVISQEEILGSIQQVLSVLTLGLGLIAGISLVVGGIGIMNIMLVSVTERIREIGLRKALGATRLDIGIQFLTESVILSVLGGVFGLLLGATCTFAIQNYIRAEIPISAVFLAFGFASIVGIVFGTYPALDASKKDPIEALRYE